MSTALHDYTCDRCSLRCPVGAAPGPIPIYDLGEGNVAPVPSRAAWCATCAVVTRAESLARSPAAVDAAIDRAQADAQRYATDDDEFFRQLAALDAQYVASSGAWHRWAAERRVDGERCLRCGNVAPSLEILEGDAVWPKRFRHPGCGGVISVIEGDLRIAWCDPEFETIAFGRDWQQAGS